MNQLPLFPSAAANARPLPEAVQKELRERVSDLLVAVLLAIAEKQRPRRGVQSDE